MLDGEITRHWSNTYYFSDDYLAGWQASYDGHDAIRNFVLRERELHFTPVHYSHVTAYNVSGDITDGMCMWPYEGTLTGFWAPWSGLCPWGYARRHVFTPITGRSRQLWIRGGLQNADITLTPGGRLLLPALAGWNNNFQTAIAGMMSFLPQNTWWLRHGTTHPGSAIYLNPVSWKCTGASLMNAIDRAQERYMGGGEDLYEEALHITEYAARFFSFALTFNTPTPHQWYVRTYFNDLLTFVGEVGGFAKSVGDYFAPPGGDDNGGGNVARWYPDSGTASDTAKSFKSLLDDMKDALNRISWNPDGDRLWCSDTDWGVIWNAAHDIAKKSAWLATLDYKTPQVEQ